MESLNYTQLASVVLVLSVASLLLFIISLILVLAIRKQKETAKKIDKRVDYFAEKIDEKLNNFLSGERRNSNDILKIFNVVNYLESQIKSLIKPKYEIGDKVETTDGIKGTITDIKREDGTFMYEITERSYFNRPAKKHNRIEFLIMKA